MIFLEQYLDSLAVLRIVRIAENIYGAADLHFIKFFG